MDAKLDTGWNSDRTQYGTYTHEIKRWLTTQHRHNDVLVFLTLGCTGVPTRLGEKAEGHA
jgi:hypothetical protein